MRYAAAYLLAVLGGNPTPKVTDIAKILGSVGVDCDEERAQLVVDACKGRNLEEIIADGIKKLDSLPADSAPTAVAEVSTVQPTAVQVTAARTPSRPVLSGDEEDDDEDFVSVQPTLVSSLEQLSGVLFSLGRLVWLRRPPFSSFAFAIKDQLRKTHALAQHNRFERPPGSFPRSHVFRKRWPFERITRPSMVRQQRGLLIHSGQ